MNKLTAETSYLFATPSFFGGMASVLDIGGTLLVYNQSSTPAEADTKAMKNDWKAVEKDLIVSMQEYGKGSE